MSVESTVEFELPGATLRFRFSGHSDRGAVRRVNEDSFLVAPPLFVVADGMGGHAFGDRASQASIAAFAGKFDEGGPASAQAVLDTIAAANEAVLALSDGAEGALSGTTLTGVAFVDIGASHNYHWMAFNVGDSRTYSWDGRSLAQVSVDHSAVQELIDLGEITRLEAENHPNRNIVTRALGAGTPTSSDSTTTTVTLSEPPAAIAARTRRSGRLMGRLSLLRTDSVSWNTMMRAISSSPSSLVRPSEHRRKVWRARAGSSQMSASTTSSAPRARVTILRFGWLSASSRVISPRSISSCTAEWSTLTCASDRPSQL